MCHKNGACPLPHPPVLTYSTPKLHLVGHKLLGDWVPQHPEFAYVPWVLPGGVGHGVGCDAPAHLEYTNPSWLGQHMLPGSLGATRLRVTFGEFTDCPYLRSPFFRRAKKSPWYPHMAPRMYNVSQGSTPHISMEEISFVSMYQHTT